MGGRGEGQRKEREGCGVWTVEANREGREGREGRKGREGREGREGCQEAQGKY